MKEFVIHRLSKVLDNPWEDRVLRNVVERSACDIVQFEDELKVVEKPLSPLLYEAMNILPFACAIGDCLDQSLSFLVIVKDKE